MSESSARKYCSNIGGLCFWLADGAMTFKDTLVKAFDDNEQSITEIASGLATPDTAIGTTFVAGASVLTAKGHTDKGKVWGWGITALGSVALTAKYAIEGNYGEAFGSFLGLTTSTWICIQAKRRMNRQSEVEEQFQENEEPFTKRYPAVVPSLINIGSSTFIGVNAWLRGDKPMAYVALAWGVGNVFNAFSPPEMRERAPNQALFQPA